MNPLLGIGLRHHHYQQVLEERPSIGWFEVHSENFFHHDSSAITTLNAIREHYPISLHGVGLSLGSAKLPSDHLQRLKRLTNRISPFLISEHLSWNHFNGMSMPDLLPIPYTAESLELISQNVNITQDYLNHEILIENPSSYIQYACSEQAEVDFLISLCNRTGAKILLDINNIFVSCSNHGWNAKHYIDSIPDYLVKEIHLAGHSIKNITPDTQIHIDTHDRLVCAQVWALYAYAIKKLGHIPTLLEWDAKIPTLEVLVQEAKKALIYLDCNEQVHAIN